MCNRVIIAHTKSSTIIITVLNESYRFKPQTKKEQALAAITEEGLSKLVFKRKTLTYFSLTNTYKEPFTAIKNGGFDEFKKCGPNLHFIELHTEAADIPTATKSIVATLKRCKQVCRFLTPYCLLDFDGIKQIEAVAPFTELLLQCSLDSVSRGT